MFDHPAHSSRSWRSGPGDETVTPTRRADPQEGSASTHRIPSDARHYSPTTSSIPPPPETSTPTRDDEEATAAAPQEGRRIYVGNLLYSAQPSDITWHFTEAGYTISNISVSMDSLTGRNPSYCFVGLESRDAAEDAMQSLNGTRET